MKWSCIWCFKIDSPDDVTTTEACICHCHASVSACIGSTDLDRTPFVVILAYVHGTGMPGNKHLVLISQINLMTAIPKKAWTFNYDGNNIENC